MGLILMVAIACLWWTTTPMPSHLVSNMLVTYLLVWGGTALNARRSASEIRRRFFLMTGAIGLTLACLELPAVIGLVDYDRMVPGNRIRELHSRNNLSDPDLLHRRPPRFRAVGRTKGDLVISTHARVSSAPWYHYDLRYDQNGFRNMTELTQSDIAVIGDSFIEGG